jgi:AraC family transcriptional regulator, positive regulator of tynA and feaB
MIGPSRDVLTAPDLNYVVWQDVVRKNCGRYTPSGIEPSSFSGKAIVRNVFGLRSVELSTNAPRLERTQQDARDDAKDHYYALFQVTGASRIIQNDRIEELTTDDVALVDAARAVTLVSDLSESANVHWRSLQLPRHSLVSHLGLELKCPCRVRGASAARALHQLIRDYDEESVSATGGTYMRLAFYDLLGGLFAPCNSIGARSHTDKLFARICNIIKVHFTNPSFGPSEVAAEARISLRYVQKLFAERNSTCNHCINSLRLDRAATLLERRSVLKTHQSTAEIAYISGFGDYTAFTRRFRRRFGYTPSSHSHTLARPTTMQPPMIRT